MFALYSKSEKERGILMAKTKNIILGRKSGQTKVRSIQVRNRKIAITLHLDKPDALRLAKEVERRWGKK